MSNNAEDLLVAFQHFFPQAKTIGSYVGGELVEGAGETIQLFDAATGEKSIVYKDGGAAVVVELDAGHACAQDAAQQSMVAMTDEMNGGRHRRSFAA